MQWRSQVNGCLGWLVMFGIPPGPEVAAKGCLNVTRLSRLCG